MAGRTIYEINLFNMHIMGYVFFIIAVIFGLVVWKVKFKEKHYKKVAGTALAIFILMFTSAVSGHFQCYRTYKSGDYEVLEGSSSNYVRESDTSKLLESFVLQEHTFQYAFVFMDGRLSHSLSKNLQEGTRVRVFYSDEKILKVEVLD